MFSDTSDTSDDDTEPFTNSDDEPDAEVDAEH